MSKRPISDQNEVKKREKWDFDFVLPEKPSWRKDSNDPILVDHMLDEIISCRKAWKMADNEDRLDENAAAEFEKSLKVDFIQHINTAEDIGTRTPEKTETVLQERDMNVIRNMPEEERVTSNMGRAYDYLTKECATDGTTENASRQSSQSSEEGYNGEPLPKYTREELIGTLDENVVKETHKILMDGLSNSKAGIYSIEERYTTRQDGTRHCYPRYSTEEEASTHVRSLIDNTNAMVESIKGIQNEKEKLKMLFKCASIFFFSLLEIHPFGDGNGRLSRLLCSWILNVFNPFPTPVYNIYSETTRDDYIKAIYQAQETYCPAELTVMIIECSWYGWKKYLEKVIKVMI